MILALDIATKTGWARSDGRHGTLDLSEYKDDFGKMGLAFSGWLERKFRRGVTFLALEAPVQGLPNANVYHLTGLAFVAHVEAHRLGIPRREIPPKTLKKFATGNGRASKEDMILAAKSWGYNPSDDHQADALAILKWAEQGLVDAARRVA